MRLVAQVDARLVVPAAIAWAAMSVWWGSEHQRIVAAVALGLAVGGVLLAHRVARIRARPIRRARG